ncbi:MAG TPA: hypothetical protein VFZ32_11685 [Micromonosporaceae bacterium]
MWIQYGDPAVPGLDQTVATQLPKCFLDGHIGRAGESRDLRLAEAHTDRDTGSGAVAVPTGQFIQNPGDSDPRGIYREVNPFAVRPTEPFRHHSSEFESGTGRPYWEHRIEMDSQHDLNLRRADLVDEFTWRWSEEEFAKIFRRC